jgi:hypothetical protein
MILSLICSACEVSGDGFRLNGGSLMQGRNAVRAGRWGLPAWLIIFGAAFGYVEAAVVHYLRALMGFGAGYNLGPIHVLVDLKAIKFVQMSTPFLRDAGLQRAETIREAATIVMLLAVAAIAGRTWRRRLGAFLVTFAIWDLTYYLWLRILDGWPHSLFDQDVYFFIPVAWVGPVITPVICSVAIFAAGLWLIAGRKKRSS